MKIRIIATLLLLVTNFSFSHAILAQTKSCTSNNEGERIGDYVCRNGRWEYDP